MLKREDYINDYDFLEALGTKLPTFEKELIQVGGKIMNKVEFIETFEELAEFIKDKELITVQHIIKQFTYEDREYGITTNNEEMTMVIYKEEE